MRGGEFERAPVSFLSARVTNRVEALAIWEVGSAPHETGVPTLMALARSSLANHLALSAPTSDAPIPPNVIPVQVVLTIDDDQKVQPGTVSVPIEERYGRNWAEETMTQVHDRALRLVLQAIQGRWAIPPRLRSAWAARLRAPGQEDGLSSKCARSR